MCPPDVKTRPSSDRVDVGDDGNDGATVEEKRLIGNYLPSLSSLRWMFSLINAPVNYVVDSTMTLLRWVPSSKTQLQQAEQRVLSCKYIRL